MVAFIAVGVAGFSFMGSLFSLMEVRALRAEVAALSARPATSAPTDQGAPLDLSPWAALPAGEPVRVHRDELQASQASYEMARGARVVPAFERGRSVGFKLFSIRDGSLFKRIGMENGDVVVAINDLPMDTPDRALALLETLRTATSLKVSLRRRGKPMRLDLAIE